MTGDGVNDALPEESRYRGPWHYRHRGLKEAAVMILTDDNFATIVKASSTAVDLRQPGKYIRFQMGMLCAFSYLSWRHDIRHSWRRAFSTLSAVDHFASRCPSPWPGFDKPSLV